MVLLSHRGASSLCVSVLHLFSFLQVLVAYNILKELLYLVLVQQYVMLYKSLCLTFRSLCSNVEITLRTLKNGIQL